MIASSGGFTRSGADHRLPSQALLLARWNKLADLVGYGLDSDSSLIVPEPGGSRSAAKSRSCMPGCSRLPNWSTASSSRQVQAARNPLGTSGCAGPGFLRRQSRTQFSSNTVARLAILFSWNAMQQFPYANNPWSSNADWRAFSISLSLGRSKPAALQPFRSWNVSTAWRKSASSAPAPFCFASRSAAASPVRQFVAFCRSVGGAHVGQPQSNWQAGQWRSWGRTSSLQLVQIIQAR